MNLETKAFRVHTSMGTDLKYQKWTERVTINNVSLYEICKLIGDPGEDHEIITEYYAGKIRGDLDFAILKNKIDLNTSKGAILTVELYAGLVLVERYKEAREFSITALTEHDRERPDTMKLDIINYLTAAKLPAGTVFNLGEATSISIDIKYDHDYGDPDVRNYIVIMHLAPIEPEKIDLDPLSSERLGITIDGDIIIREELTDDNGGKNQKCAD